MTVGFIGLGNMGAAMAANLLKAGHALAVYNRSAAKAEPLVALGAGRAATPAAAAAAGLVFTMLADDSALEQLCFGGDGLLAGLPPGGLHIGCSTVSPALSARLAAAHGERGQAYVAAPVFGRPDAAAAARLFVMAAGAEAALDRAEPLLAVLSQRIFRLGAEPATANLVKLSGNFLILSVIEALGEAIALVDKGGVDRRVFVELLTATLFDAPVYRTYGGLIADRRYQPAGFAAPLGLKDIRLALAAAEDLRVPMPLASLLRDRFLRLLAQGGDQLDWSAIASLAASDSGQN